MPTSRQPRLFSLPYEASSRSEEVQTLEVLVEEVLPERAASSDYPVRVDHCFKRIAYNRQSLRSRNT
ncbi:MAG: hypothetical protein BRD30_07405 [Bacteroidetes bacterium QH_2_63_10]|jgi:hypothetical protein|nr:MAG: hypothetical protein BRD33_00920 [Bacteroidetes bacterium QH_6_63_17]PSQ88222.1 MAG: hypothetical protein BRD30_07405 [Bacteroidetes bacterium QH_2_63_10]